MQTIEIDKEVFEDMVKSMQFLHTMVSRMWKLPHTAHHCVKKLLHPPAGSGKWLTPYAAANAMCITVRQLQTLKSSGKIGYFQEPGGNCLFSEAEIGRYLDDNRMEAGGSL